MNQIEIEQQKSADLAQKLKSLACIECVKGWLDKYTGEKQPIEDIVHCGKLGLISQQLEDRLIKEVRIVQRNKDI